MYIIAGIAFASTRLPSFSKHAKPLLALAFTSAVIALGWHAISLWQVLTAGDGLHLSIGSTASVIGLQLALIALLGAVESSLRGLAGGLLILGAFASAFLDPATPLR
jgi:ABC-type uncharacterized transport system permease subunit